MQRTHSLRRDLALVLLVTLCASSAAYAAAHLLVPARLAAATHRPCPQPQPAPATPVFIS